MRKNLLIALVCLCQFIYAQDKGTVTGTVTDKELNGETLPFANIFIKGTSIGGTTDLDGKYTISVPAGNHVLVFSFVGYQTIEKPITVVAGKTLIVNQELGASGGEQLDEVQINTTINREKESALLLEQKKAVAIQTKIGAQELAKKGVSDATAAVAKTAGVVIGSKNIVVRGLGDRYNSTSFNGIPLPSEDPEYKNISLNFFETSIIKNIGVNKVFDASISGDVAGANVDINSKELSKRELFNIGFSLGANSQTFSKDFLTIDGANFFGTQNANIPITSLNSYDFQNSFSPNRQNIQLANGFSIAYGKKFDIKESNKLTFFIVGDYNSSYNFYEGNIKQTTSTGTIFLDQNFLKYDYNVSQLIMGNVKYKFGSKNSIAFNTLYIHNNKQAIGDYEGISNPEQTGDIEFQRRQQTNDNNLFVNQLLGEFNLSERFNLETKLAFNYVTGDEPDRRTNKYLLRDGFYSPQTNSAGENERYFSNLKEKDYNTLIKLNYKLKGEDDEDNISKIEFGGNFRFTDRLFNATIFNHGFNTRVPIEINNPDAVFNNQNLNNGTFFLETGRGGSNNPRAFNPFFYSGEKFIIGGFSNVIYKLNDNLLVSGGVRAENVDLDVLYNTNIANSDINGPSKIQKFYVLPNFNIKYNFNEDNILRFAASQTYTLPQFKEIAPFKYQDISFSSQGNPNLIPSDNYNFDLKYEYYLSKNELITVTGFYKYIKNPISRSEIPSAGNTLTYLNIGNNAQVFGAELEARKILSSNLEDVDFGHSFELGVNVSYLNSNVDLDQTSIAQFTNTSSELEGATPILVNADISYFNKINNDSEFRTTAVFNYFGDRVYSVGTRGFQNIIEKGIPTLDWISSYKLSKSYSLKLKATNLLDPSFELNRKGSNSGDNVKLGTYKKGVNLSLGISVQF